MALELLGARMAGIYFGNSLYVWTSILSITVGGLAAGYFLGGSISQKFDSRKAMYFAFLAAALLTLTMPGWANFVMLFTMDLGYQTGVILSCLLFVFPVMMALGTIPPNIINILTEDSESSGGSTGNVYTVSTFGGIFTTILVGFYVIPNFGLRATTYVIAGILVTAPFFYFLKSKILVALGIIFTFGFTMVVGLKPGKPKSGSHVRIVYKSDGLLGQMIVADDLSTEKRSLMVNNISQTFMHIPSRRSQWRYVHRMAMYASMMPAGSNVLICGIGGGNLINELTALGFNIDAVDLDKRMAQVATKYFAMSGTATIFEDDARHFIRTSTKTYDIIILDMSSGENQPSNVYTVECFKEIRNMLNEDGILFLHYQNTLEGEHSIAIKSLGRTLAEAELNPQLLNTDKVNKDGTKTPWGAAVDEVTGESYIDTVRTSWDKIGELMLFGSKKTRVLNSELERRDRFADPFNFARGDNIVIEGYDFSDGLIFTDDMPIMDALHTSTLHSTRGASIETLIPIYIAQEIDML